MTGQMLTEKPPEHASGAEPIRLPIAQIMGWTLFAAAFGYTEAVLVVYLRRLLGEAPGLDYRQIFALKHLSFNAVVIAQDMARHQVLDIERCREVATLLLLLGAALAAGKTLRQRLAVFLFTFAVWDETYYLFLSFWSGFPHNLTQTDIYFLVPIAWYGPVWFPVLVVMPLMILSALWLHSSEPASS